jgi:3-phytase
MLAAGQVNNVDLRDGVAMASAGNGLPGVLVGASDRTDLTRGHIALFRLETSTANLLPLGRLPVAQGEAYGFCLWRRSSDRMLFAFLVMKDGAVVQAQLDLSGPTPSARVVRTVKLGSQAEGCAADDRTGLLYVAEEDVGVWLIDADPDSPAVAKPFAKVDGRQLFADAEGVAIAPTGADGGMLLVSSQGDSAYAAYRLNGGEFVGWFRIEAGASIDGTSDTDGIDVALGDFGPAFPDGMLVVQDGNNAPEAQNFKIVPWGEVSRALGTR